MDKPAAAILGLPVRALWFFAVLLFFILCPRGRPAFADTVILKSGEILRTTVERFSDGAFWVKEGSKTVVLRPEEISKIVFDLESRQLSQTPAKPASVRSGHLFRPDTVQAAAPRARGGHLADPPIPIPEKEFPGDIPAAEATGEGVGDSAEAGLSILNYNAVMTSGIFQIIGEVQNRMKSVARYVKVSVILFDASGNMLDQNFSYVLGNNPSLAPMEKKSFRISFLNPPDGVAKYKIRVESSQF